MAGASARKIRIAGMALACTLQALPAAAELPRAAAEGVAGGAPKPTYALRSRFSGTAGVVTFTSVKPRALPRPDPATNLASAAPANPATIGSVMIPGMPSARSGVLLTSRFGARAAPMAGASRLHPGLDLAAPYGSAVVARSPGLVIAAGWAGGYGNCVVIDHGGGVQTRYGHLSRIAVRVGQHVDPGALLGAVGSTGLSTGPHLHYEVRVNGAAINPLAR